MYICILCYVLQELCGCFSVFKAKHAEMNWAVKHSGPRDVMSEMEAIVRLRGLPYGCSKEEIANFFSGNISVQIRLK